MAKSKPTWGDWLQENQWETVVVKVPDALQASPWKPTEEDRKAAWTLLTELRTRIATQALHYRSGDEETALDSLYKLFGFTRDAIKAGGPDARHFATIATSVLNTHVRPLTARWHKKKIEGRLLNDDERREFRRELNTVRSKLVVFCNLLDRLSAKEQDTPDDGSCGRGAQEEPTAGLGADIAFKPHSLPAELYDAELSAIRQRREQPEGEVNNLAGLACSGGGIRSATLCLGVVQALAKQKTILPDVDYLSTVSGGGYFGAFLSSFLNSPDQKDVGLQSGKLPFAETDRAEPTPIRKLRNNSKYLLQGGFLGQARMAGLLLFGILVNLLALLPFLFGVLTVSKIFELFVSDDTLVGFTLYGSLGVLAFFVLGLPIIQHRWDADRERIARYEHWALLSGLLVVVVWFIGYAAPSTYSALKQLLESPQAVVGAFFVLPFVLAACAFAVGADKQIGRLLIVLAGIAAPLLLLMAFYALDDWATAEMYSILGLLLVSAALVAWLLLIDMNRVSPHRYYRNRLVEAYLLQKDASNAKAVDPQPLHKLRSKNPTAPYHLINAAVNLPASKQAELRGRMADFFLFTQDYCGSPLLGYSPTDQMERKDSHLDLGTAMSISGAAASSFMGTKTIKGLAFWLALLNIRLAYWLPNPNPKVFKGIANSARVRPLSLWRELTGKLDENNDFVNLSDGGHIENLGLYELLRRHCKFIVAIDGEADPDMQFGSLMQLIRYAQIDLGTRIRLDLEDLSKNAAGYSKAHFVLGEIEYGNGETGYLLYIKSSLTGNERDYVLDYQHRSPDFPHESTADQFFSEAQFEAYRALGEHIGDELFRQDLIETDATLSLKIWFERLARNLLPQ